ncbi:MAG: MATE family efflux transporter [Clostridia bacterium]|nr:MATE family efflux transporter [Clostridia bacterium]
MEDEMKEETPAMPEEPAAELQGNANSFMATEKLGKLMVKFAIPCIISLLVGALYNIVDQIFIGNADYLGTAGNTANSLVFPLTVVALALATMIGDGCCTFVSISLGSNKPEDAHKNIANSVILVVIIGIILMALYLLIPNALLSLFGANPDAESYPLAQEYLFWIAIGIPFYMFGQAMNPIIRSDGSPTYAMVTLVSGAVINVVLDYVFIYPLQMGMTGAALATIIGQIVAAILALVYLFRMKAVKLHGNSFKPALGTLRHSLVMGIPSFLVQISIVFSMMAVLQVCNICGQADEVYGQAGYTDIPQAVVGIVMKYFQIVISIAVGISAGCIPIVGYNIGAGRKDRAKKLLFMMIAAEAVVGAIFTLLFELLPSQLLAVFGAGTTLDPAVTDLADYQAQYRSFGINCIRWFMAFTILACVNKGIIIYLQALGRSWLSTIVSLVREILFGVGGVLLLAFPMNLGLAAVFYFMPIADGLTFVVAAVIVGYITKVLSRKHTDQFPVPDGSEKKEPAEQQS